MLSTWVEVADCGLVQANYYATPNGSALTTAQRAAINGQVQGFCTSWAGFLGASNPTTANNCGNGFPAALVSIIPRATPKAFAAIPTTTTHRCWALSSTLTE